MPKHPMADVVVLLPGILGSVLERDGREVWAPTPGAVWRGLWRLGRSVQELRLGEDPHEEDDLGDGVRATRLVPDVHLVPGLWSIDGYSGIRNMILNNFAVEPGMTYLECPYDWRRDNRVAARTLARLVTPALREVRRHNPDAKLVLLGHSMGGLVARYFLECLDGWRDTRMLITFGTPYRGSLNALNFVANGFRKRIGPLTLLDLTDLLRSLTSVYQLLPVYECLDLGGSAPVRAAESQGVPFLDTDRAAAALRDFHRAIEAGVGGRPERAYEVHPVVGLTQPTAQSARLVRGTLETARTRLDSSGRLVDESGDGTVPRVSATPIELGSRPPAVYARQRHGSLQNVDNVHVQLLGLLTQVADLGDVRDVRAGLALILDDVFAPDEPVAVQVEVPRIGLAAAVTDLGTGVTGDPVPLADAGDGRHAVELPPLPPGEYRVTIAGSGEADRLVAPVGGLLMVPGAEPAAP